MWLFTQFVFVDSCSLMRVSHGNLHCVSQSWGVLLEVMGLGHPGSCDLSFPGVAVDD